MIPRWLLHRAHSSRGTAGSSGGTSKTFLLALITDPDPPPMSWVGPNGRGLLSLHPMLCPTQRFSFLLRVMKMWGLCRTSLCSISETNRTQDLIEYNSEDSQHVLYPLHFSTQHKPKGADRFITGIGFPSRFCPRQGCDELCFLTPRAASAPGEG